MQITNMYSLKAVKENAKIQKMKKEPTDTRTGIGGWTSVTPMLVGFIVVTPMLVGFIAVTHMLAGFIAVTHMLVVL